MTRAGTGTPAILSPFQVAVLRVTAAYLTYLGIKWFVGYLVPGEEGHGQTDVLIKAASFLVLANLLIVPCRLGVVAAWFIALDSLGWHAFFLFREIAPHPGLILGVVIYSPYVILLALPTANILADWLRWLRQVWGRHTCVDRRT